MTRVSAAQHETLLAFVPNKPLQNLCTAVTTCTGSCAERNVTFTLLVKALSKVEY